MPPIETFTINTSYGGKANEKQTAQGLANELNRVHEEIVRRRGRVISSLVVDARSTIGHQQVEHIFITADIPTPIPVTPPDHPGYFN